jgi:hypothetical protein
MDPDPDPALEPDPDPCITMQKYFVTLFYFLSLKNDVNVASKSNKQIKLCSKISFLADILKVNDEYSRIRIQDPDP